MNFGQALELVKAGHQVRRSGWNGRGVFIFYVGGHLDERSWTYTDGKQDNYPNLPFIAMKTADDKVVPWLANQTDLLAEDWEQVR